MGFRIFSNLNILPHKRSVHFDAARATAALVVFSGHTRAFFLQFWRTAVGLGETPKDSDVAIFTSPSHEAVIVFFVLSGLLVGGAVVRSFQSAKWSWSKYLGARLARLWVVLIAALILTAILDAIGKWIAPLNSLYFIETPELAGESSWTAFFGNVAFLQTILVPTFGSDGQLWSLANEFWYYILFPMLVTIFLANSISSKIAAACGFAAILVFIGYKIAVYFPIWLIGLIPLYLPRVVYARKVSLLLATLLLFLTLILLVKLRLNLLLSDSITGLAFALWCHVAMSNDKREPAPLYSWAATHLARMSYTLYLVHVPILLLISAILVRPWRPWPLDEKHLAAVDGIWLFVLLASYLFYLVFERNTDSIKRFIGNLLTRRAKPRG